MDDSGENKFSFRDYLSSVGGHHGGDGGFDDMYGDEEEEMMMMEEEEEDVPTQLIPPEFRDEGLTQPVPPASSLSSTQGMSQAATQIVPQAMRSQQHRRQPSFADAVRTPEVKKPVPSAHVEKTKSTGADAGKSLPSRKPKRRGRRNQGADVPQRPYLFDSAPSGHFSAPTVVLPDGI